MSDLASPKVLVIEHEWNVDIALVGDRLAAAGLAVETVGPDRAVAIPDHLEGVDGLLVLGGKMDPDDDTGAPWLPAVRRLLREAIGLQLPTMGICLGAQLLGMAVGGRVRLIPAGPEIGLHRVRPTEAAGADPLLHHLLPDGRRVLEWHWWEVTDLPEQCDGQPVTVLAEGEQCPVQAFVVGEVVWGMQFHLEALARTAEAWARSDPARLTDLGIDPDRLVADVTAAESELIDSWAPVVDSWAEVVHARAAG
ncbi:MAG: type 1 glutamine amidotransferase [Dermatophilaceae bacterium]|nr:type 1 glutamine amidotransferase [Intrasporangiaceae bacterium]